MWYNLNTHPASITVKLCCCSWS